jgi:hypothetical protein
MQLFAAKCSQLRLKVVENNTFNVGVMGSTPNQDYSRKSLITNRFQDLFYSVIKQTSLYFIFLNQGRMGGFSGLKMAG